MDLRDVFILIFVVVFIRDTVAAETNYDQCSNLIPLSDDFRYGYDLTQFSTFICPDDAGRRGQIMDINRCSFENKHRMRDINATEYLLADGMTKFGNSMTRVETEKIFLNSSDFVNEYFMPMVRLRNSKSNDISKGLFVNNEDYQRYSLYVGDFKVGVVYWKAKEIELNLPETELRKYLNSVFISDIKGLPNNFKNNEEQYLNFIKKYGTHVMTKGVFGGINRRIVLEWDENKKTSGNFLKLPDKGVDIMCNKVDGNSRVIRFHDERINFVQEVIGGKANEYTNITIHEWTESVKRMPSLINAEMIPISDLIKDNQISSNVYQAIRIYMMNAYKEYQSLNLLSLLNNGYSSRNETLLINNKIENMKPEDRYNATYIELISDELRDECNYLRVNEIPTKLVTSRLFKNI